MEIILLCLYGKVTVIVIFLIIYLYWIWKKVRLIKWEQAPGDTRDLLTASFRFYLTIDTLAVQLYTSHYLGMFGTYTR